ncbi:MAG: rhomboid family intramembrane serine protease [Candidatus Bipolaricaulota bacterium]
MIPIRDTRPSYRFSWVTVTLITLNVAIFLVSLGISTQSSKCLDLTQWARHDVTPSVQLIRERDGCASSSEVSVSGKSWFYLKYGAVPGEITSFTDFSPSVAFPVFFTLITSTFLHGGFFHLIGNMLFLWIFGDNVEDAMGHFRFIAFYFIAGIAGSILHIVFNPGSGTPMVGASGAIAGVMAAYLLLYPNSRIVTLVPIFFFFTFIQIPAFIMVGLWFLFELFMAFGDSVGSVARWAHVGGFLAGILLTPYFKSDFIRIKFWDLWR